MLEKYILRTPLISYDEKIYLKPENLQAFGSYKIRGVASAIAHADPARLKKGLVTISAGNMAQAVAFAATELNIPCTIYIPDSAPEIKKAALRKMNATIIELPFGEIWKMVKTGDPELFEGLLIHPVFTPGIQEGYEKIAGEIINDCPDVDAIVIPFGVGGLTSGMTRMIKKMKPGIAIYACEPVTASPLSFSLASGKACSVQRFPSFIDAIGTPEVLPEVFEYLQDKISASILITPEEAMRSAKELLIKHKILCEGAAAVSFAAARKLSLESGHKKICCVLSGGNIAPELLLA